MEGITYVIIDDCAISTAQIKNCNNDFQELHFLGTANNAQYGLDLVLAFRPKLIFLSIDSNNKTNGLSLSFIDLLHKYLAIVPKIVVVSKNKQQAFEAINYHVSGYLLKPIQKNELVKTVLPIAKRNWFENGIPNSSISFRNQMEANLILNHSQISKSLILCVKSYGDYRYICADEVVYFQADNNSTDIYLQSGEMITAFKTLKHFENLLQAPFYRIHNSYLINSRFISRIHTGSKLCTLRYTSRKIPFSKSYRENIELIIERFSGGNCIEF